MGQAFGDPLESTLEGFVSDACREERSEAEQNDAADRDARFLSYASAKGAGRKALAPVQSTSRENLWGGGLRRMTSSGVGPRREDEHRYVSVGFARYLDPAVDPAGYAYYPFSGWRVAVPRTISGPAVWALFLQMSRYGPESAGYARLGDTLVPAVLGPGDRQRLAESGPAKCFLA